MPFCLLFDLTVYFRLLSLNDGHTIAISRAVNSPLRSRLLPTQPWKVAEVEEAENAMSVTYKKVLGQRKGQQASNPSGALSGQQKQASFDRTPTKVGVSPFLASEGDLGGFGQEPWEGGCLEPARLVLQPLPHTDVWA